VESTHRGLCTGPELPRETVGVCLARTPCFHVDICAVSWCRHCCVPCITLTPADRRFLKSRVAVCRRQQEAVTLLSARPPAKLAARMLTAAEQLLQQRTTSGQTDSSVQQHEPEQLPSAVAQLQDDLTSAHDSADALSQAGLAHQCSVASSSPIQVRVTDDCIGTKIHLALHVPRAYI
jgi:hypothetical protein